MTGLILLSILLLTGSNVRSEEALMPGGTCDTNGAMSPVLEDNKLFYLCSNGIVYMGSCNDGRYFDPSTSACITSAAAEPKSQIDCQDKNFATYAYPEQNSRYYYCFDNQPLIVQCPDDYYYDADSQSCATTSTPIRTQCPPSVNKFIPLSCTSYTFCLNGVPYQQTCPNGFFFNNSTNTCTTTKPTGCTDAKGNCTIGEIKADPSSCQSYLYCRGSEFVSVRCPSNYYFDAGTSNCSPKLPNNCPTGVNNPVTLSPITPEPVYPSIPLPTYSDSKVCSNNLNAVIADSVNCNRYFVCINGSPYELYCQNGFYYNLDSRVCEKDIPSTCTTQNSTDDDDTCPPFAEILLADPTNCKNYILCDDGLATSYTCDQDFFFDPQVNACSPVAPPSCTVE